MDEIHKRILQRNRSYLVDNIEDVIAIVDDLFEKDILTEGMKQDIIQGQNTTNRQIRKLLDILPKRGPSAFDIFCNALAKHKHRHVAIHLNPTMAALGATPVPPEQTHQQVTGGSNIGSSTQASGGSGSGIPQASGGSGNKIPTASGGSLPSASLPQPMSFDIKKQPKPNPGQSHGFSNPSNQNPGYHRQPSGESIHDKSYTAFQFPIDWPSSLNMAPFGSKDFDVDPCTQEDIDMIRRRNIYRMLSSHRGLAVIINNQEFCEDGRLFAKRTSSEKDSNRLQQVLKLLAFEVVIKRDVKFKDMEMTLKWLSTMEHDGDSFILIILSYGGEGTVFTADGKEMQIQDIVNTFSTEKCGTLIGKPKLVFIQACGVKLQDGQTRPPMQFQSEVDYTAGITKGLADLSLGKPRGDVTDTNPGPDTGTVLPVDTSDSLVAMATSPDLDNPDLSYGSVFILALSYVFCHCSRNEDLRMMLDRINSLQKDINTGRYIKLCEIRSSLNRKLYFLPGYPLKGSDPDRDFPSSHPQPAPAFGNTQTV